MKKQLLSLSLLAMSCVSIGQTWAPLGATWSYGVGNAWSPLIEACEWVSTGDTVIEGHNCRVISRMCDEVASDITDQLITYEDSSIIYWYCMNQFTVLYDFNKVAGESWTIQFDTCSLVVTVDSTSMETINNVPLKAMYIYDENSSFNGKVLEHIGHTMMPNPAILFHCYQIFSDANFYLGLRCYEDSIIGFHSFGIARSCDFTNIGIREEEDPFGLSVYPNPASDDVTVQTELSQKYLYRICNSFGQEIRSGILNGSNTSLDIQDLPNGVYLLGIMAEGKQVRRRFVVQR